MIWIPVRLYKAIPRYSMVIGGLSLLVLPVLGKILGLGLVIYATTVFFKRSQYL